MKDLKTRKLESQLHFHIIRFLYDNTDNDEEFASGLRYIKELAEHELACFEEEW